MRKLLIVAICSFTLLTACSQKDDSLEGYESKLEEEKTKFTETLNEKEKKIEELNQTIQQLNTQIDNYNTEKENYAFISNISMEFVQAHTTGDKDKLRQLLSDDILLEEKDNKLYAKNAQGYEWLLFNNEKKTQFDDWVIQGYEYDRESNTYHIFIREFYISLNGEPESPPTFLYLSFIKVNEEWKIHSLEFDV
ncbi:hypothetical protein J45TS6_48510 [Paenibacillus sp. J45TS6]|uniref:hypothetical protein n=1 Tax=Paenibacillus sp. J45TS6 TaxID=2807196 RepID=UPI001B1E9557|nr:hypothetical protein [Paenibacillus sp. J45TS6]GIP46392.1 hypothetical protein J45TS6_48510 [Paenibacillus sp. J45TS6]